MLNQVSVLIVEGEPFIALDLATAVEEARGKVIGPAGSVREACGKLFYSLNMNDRFGGMLPAGWRPVAVGSWCDLALAIIHIICRADAG